MFEPNRVITTSQGQGMIRESKPDDQRALEALYPDAFPDEDLVPLVRQLLQEPSGVLSLVAINDASIIGHAAFTRCHLAENSDKQALLGPLAVASNNQGKGVGSQLVRNGLQRLETSRFTKVYVLGDPNYYSRFGFKREVMASPPYPLPTEWREAWQSLYLQKQQPLYRGELCLPTPWLNPALWAP